jgi:catechol-2,3-dioxygenase
MLLQRLTLYTPNIERTIDFYGHTLKFPLLMRSLQSVTFKVGRTRLTFSRRDNVKPYHFAINIPSNKEGDVLNWLREKVKLIPHQGEELIHWPEWNAKSIYCYDQDNNIVEFIARKNLEITESMPFIPTQILGISEIGMAVVNIEETYNKLKEVYEVPLYFNENNLFCAAGDETGMFIILNKAQSGWFPNNDKAYPADFILQQDDSKSIRFINGDIQVF